MGVAMKMLLALLIITGTVISGCSPLFGDKPMPCGDLLAITSKASDLGSLQLNNANKWIQSNFTLSGDVSADTYSGPAGGYTAVRSWTSDSERHDAYFIGSRGASVRVSLEGHTLTASNVLECLGEPDTFIAYRATGGERQSFIFELWYPDKGVLLRGEQFHGTQTNPSHVTPDTKVHFLSITTPTTVEEMSTLTSPTSANAQTRLEILRPWTSNWEEMTFELLPPQYIPP